MKREMPTWSAERIALARTLKAQGLSALKASRVLNATFRDLPSVSRNAVISKWSRLGLTNAMAPLAPRKDVVEAKAVQARAKARAKPPNAPIAPMSPPARTRGAKVSPRNVRFIDRIRGKQCAMFLPDQEGAHGFVCGAPVTQGEWCADCFGFVYQPETKQGKRAA